MHLHTTVLLQHIWYNSPHWSHGTHFPSLLISWSPFPLPNDLEEPILPILFDLMEPISPPHWSHWPHFPISVDQMEPIYPSLLILRSPFPPRHWSHKSHFPAPHRSLGSHFTPPQSPLISWSLFSPSHWCHEKRSPFHTDCPGNRDNWSIGASYSTGYWSSAGSGPLRHGDFSWLALGSSVADRLTAFCASNTIYLMTRFFFHLGLSSPPISSLQTVIFKIFNFRVSRSPFNACFTIGYIIV